MFRTVFPSIIRSSKQQQENACIHVDRFTRINMSNLRNRCILLVTRNIVSISVKNQKFSSSPKYPELLWGQPTLLFFILLFFLGKGSRRVKLNVLLHSVQTLRMSGIIPLLIPITSRCTQKQIRTLLLGLPSCLFASGFFSIKLLYGLLFPSVLATYAAYLVFSM
jgi:hypothetical protein